MFVLGGKEFRTTQGPTFYPETEDLFLKFDFKETPPLLKNMNIKIYERNFFTPPVSEFSAEIPSSAQELFSIALPENLKPGVYPIAINFISTDTTYLLPTLYGRFIVGGNMGKVLDVSLNTTDTKTNAISLVVQGNPSDIMSFERDVAITFDVNVFLYGKNDTLLAQQKITGQNVQVYRNIEVSLDTPIKESKIYTVKVELIDKKGIFDTYEKVFERPENSSYSIPILLCLGLILASMLLFYIIRKSKRAAILSLMCCIALL